MPERYITRRTKGWEVFDCATQQVVHTFSLSAEGASMATVHAGTLNHKLVREFPPRPDLVAWRKAHGLTQTQLAERLGVEMTTVQRWEAGQVRVPGFLQLALERLDQLLDCPR